jgi:hypothetical protein
MAEVTVFDVRPIIVKLLCNKDHMNRDNVVYKDNDFTFFDEGIYDNNNIYDDVNSGTWWKDTTRKMKQDHPDIEHCSVCYGH